MKWSAALPRQQAASFGSSTTSKRLTTSSSEPTPVPQAQAQHLPIPQQAAAAASWQSRTRSNTEAGLSHNTCTLHTTRAAGSGSGYSTSSRPLQLHQQRERDYNKGVLVMERRLAQLTQALEEAQALQEQYAQQLIDANAAHKQRIGNLEVGRG
jgi:hypothetical protein